MKKGSTAVLQVSLCCAILLNHLFFPFQPVKVELSEGEAIPDNMEVYRLQGAKPDYEVGSSSQLKLSFTSKAPGIVCVLHLFYAAVSSI